MQQQQQEEGYKAVLDLLGYAAGKKGPISPLSGETSLAFFLRAAGAGILDSLGFGHRGYSPGRREGGSVICVGGRSGRGLLKHCVSRRKGKSPLRDLRKKSSTTATIGLSIAQYTSDYIRKAQSWSRFAKEKKGRVQIDDVTFINWLCVPTRHVTVAPS